MKRKNFMPLLFPLSLSFSLVCWLRALVGPSISMDVPQGMDSSGVQDDVDIGDEPDKPMDVDGGP